MGPDHFVKVFDLLDAGYRNWTFLAVGLILVAIGVAVALFPTLARKMGIPLMEFRPRRYVRTRYVALAIGIVWTSLALIVTYLPYQRHKVLAQQGHCRVVEGRVEHFVPPDPRQLDESFTVTGVRFQYSDFARTDGFNNTSSQGGPIRANQYVRICYDPAGNVILRLEIRDFTGDAKSYAQAQPLFPFANDPKLRPPSSIQWLVSLVAALGILDVFSIWSLFLPYLRVFICIKTAAFPDLPIPNDLQSDTKIKLSNSMIYWDRKAHRIWLRPRGFSLIQLPNTIAKLNVGPDNRTIIGDEIHLSPVLPVVVALFLWIFYLSTHFAGTKTPLPIVPFLVIGVAFIVVGFVLVITTRRRMQTLVQDALQDIRRMGRDPTPRSAGAT